MSFSIPPIVKLAERVLVEIEQAVRRFARFHKYQFGSKIRELAFDECACAGRAWRDRLKLKVEELLYASSKRAAWPNEHQDLSALVFDDLSVLRSASDGLFFLWRSRHQSLRALAGVSNFFADMGDRPEGHTLDRIDTDGDYCPSNCRWAPHATQANNRRNNVFLTLGDRTQPIGLWARELNISIRTIRTRLNRGASAEAALQAVNPTRRPRIPISG